jgi:hypothetical protein
MSLPLFTNLGEHDLISEPRSEDGSPTTSDLDFLDGEIDDNMDLDPITNRRKRPRVVDSEDEAEPLSRRRRTDSPISLSTLPATPPHIAMQESPLSDTPADIPDGVLGPIVVSEPCEDAEGNPIMEPVLDKDGNPKLNRDGSPRMRKKKNSFNFNRRYIFLTYSKCDLEKDQFLSLIAELNNKFERYIACREFHDDGTPHFHLLGDFGLDDKKNPPHIRRHDAFDIGGTRYGRAEFPKFHPNIAPVMKRDAAWHYVNKLEKPAETVFGDFQDPCKAAQGITSNTFFHTAIDNAKSATDYLEAISEVIPHRVTNSWNNQVAFAEWKWGKTKKEDPQPNRWVAPRRQRKFVDIPIVSLWKKMFIDRTYRGRQVSLWFIGETQTSKSSFAKNLGPHCYIKGNINSNLVHSNCDLIVLDDIQVENFPWYKDFMNCDPFQIRTSYNRSTEFDHGLKYGKVGIPTVWTTNYDPRILPSTHKCDIDWIVGNTIFINVGNKNLSRPLTELEIDSFEISTPPNWDEHIREYHEDQTSIRRVLDVFRHRISIKKKKLFLIRFFIDRSKFLLHLKRINI